MIKSVVMLIVRVRVRERKLKSHVGTAMVTKDTEERNKVSIAALPSRSVWQGLGYVSDYNGPISQDAYSSI